MPKRSKSDAQTRLNIGFARVMMLQGKSPAEGLELFKEHLATVAALENNAPRKDTDALSQVTVTRRIGP
jgi:hypothetical protein